MLKNNCTKLPIIHKSIIIFCFGLLFLLLPVYNTQAATAYAPPKGYPMGAATDTTGFAGGKITFNSNEVFSLQGQFFAKTFTSSGVSGGAPTLFLQNYVHDPSAGLSDTDFDKVSPPMLSKNITGKDMIEWYINKNSFIFSKNAGKTKYLTYYLQNSPSAADINAAGSHSGLSADDITKQLNEKRNTASSLSDFPNMKKIWLCLDHDIPGMKAAERIKKQLLEMGYGDTETDLSQYKDWNEDLKALHGQLAIPAEELPGNQQETKQELLKME